MYLSMVSRPDISYAVNKLSRNMTNPNHKNWNAVKHIFRYLKFTREKITNGEIILKYTTSIENIADVFTKPLSHPKFTKHFNTLYDIK